MRGICQEGLPAPPKLGRPSWSINFVGADPAGGIRQGWRTKTANFRFSISDLRLDAICNPKYAYRRTLQSAPHRQQGLPAPPNLGRPTLSLPTLRVRF